MLLIIILICNFNICFLNISIYMHILIFMNISIYGVMNTHIELWTSAKMLNLKFFCLRSSTEYLSQNFHYMWLSLKTITEGISVSEQFPISWWFYVLWRVLFSLFTSYFSEIDFHSFKVLWYPQQLFILQPVIAWDWSQRSLSSCFFKTSEGFATSPFDCVLTLHVKITVQAVDLVLPTDGRDW